jgi:formylglycine-generating enzyme required for sulfatase activity
MQLTGKQVGDLQEALLDAFPTKDELRMLARIQLNETLAAIADGANQRVVIFNLVSWAERTGRVADLVAGARGQNPGNPALQQFAAAWQAQPPAAVTESPPAPEPTAAPAGPVSIDLFLSYSRKDSVAMRQVQEALRAAGLAVWTDEGLEPGTQSWQDALAEAVDQAQALVVLLSPYAAQSTWVKNEVGFAQTRNKRVFPVLVAGDAASSVPIGLINAQWIDGREDLPRAVAQELLPVLRRQLHLAEPAESGSSVQGGPKVPSVAESDGTRAAAGPPGTRPRAGKRYPVFAAVALVAALVGALGLYGVQRVLAPASAPGPTPVAAESPTQAREETPTPASTPTPVSEIAPAPRGMSGPAPTRDTPAAAPTAESTTAPTAAPGPSPTNTIIEGTTKAATDAAPETASETASDTPAAGATRTNPKDGAIYVYVPDGPFTMGSADDDPLAQETERPHQHDLYLDAFWIMRTEVTNAQYLRCVRAGACSAPDNDRWEDPAYAQHPVTVVTWQQANEYARWAGGRLPTEAEWEKACRGPDGLAYPWGNDAPTDERANFGAADGDTARVGKYPEGASPYGVLDMAGNVWEWTSSKPMDYPYDPADGREDLGGDGARVLRGGAWGYDADWVRCALREPLDPTLTYDDDGFRVVAADPGG